MFQRLNIFCLLKNSNKCIHTKSTGILKQEMIGKRFDMEGLLSNVYGDIRSHLLPESSLLKDILHYSFLKSGKMIRPKIIFLTAASINYHYHTMNKCQFDDENQDYLRSGINLSQYQIGLIGEMIHSASLVHDDLIDNSDLRRGMSTPHTVFGPVNAILSGDYIITCASQILAKIANTEVTYIISEIINDLISAELMQLTSFQNIDEKLSYYYKKTFRKAASLIANCCKATAILSSRNNNDNKLSQNVSEMAFEFGRNIGMTFQLIDDILDITASEEQLGKNSCASDIKMGLATGPVLFACEKFPQINDIIIRNLSKEGDLEQILYYIDKSKAVQETKMVARMYLDSGLKVLENIIDSPFKKMLENLSEDIFNRTRFSSVSVNDT